MSNFDSFKIVKLAPVADADIVETNIPEDDHDGWSAVTTYAANARVISTTTHTIYQSTQGSNTDNDPDGDDGTWWTPVGRTAPYRPFDGVISTTVQSDGAAVFVIKPQRIVDTIAFFNMAASEVKVEVLTPDSAIQTGDYDWWEYFYTEPEGQLTGAASRTLLDVSEIIFDYWTSFFADLSDVAARETVVSLEGSPAFPGQEIVITIGAEGEAVEIGEILIGTAKDYGTTLGGTESEIKSFSQVTTDSFGNTTILQRPAVRSMTFEIALPIADEGRVLRRFQRMANVPAVFFSTEALVDRGVLTYGFFSTVRTPHEVAGVSRLSLKVQALAGLSESNEGG